MSKAIVLAFVLLLSGAKAPHAAERFPSDAKIVKETVLNVFRMAPDCKTRDQAQLAIQPLLFVLARSRDRDADRVLLDLLSYDVGEANNEILDCIVVRRGVSNAHFAGLLSGRGASDCEKQLGTNSEFCLSQGERNNYRVRMVKAIKNKEKCEIEW